MRAIRAIRRRELFRTAAGDLLGLTDVADVGAGLSRLTDATLEATLEVAGRAVRAAPGRWTRRRPGWRSWRWAATAASSCPTAATRTCSSCTTRVPGADPQVATSYATAVANELRRLLALPGADPALEVDADLRPEGKQGPLVRTLESYAAYYAKWSKVWEAQALLRADAVVGDLDLRGAVRGADRPAALPGRAGSRTTTWWRCAGSRRAWTRSGCPAAPTRPAHLKLGRGGLADIEWTVQLLQMRHAGTVESLRTTRTLEALVAAREAGLVEADDAEVLAHAWRTVSRIRNAVTLVRGRPADQLPRDPRERAAVASMLDYPPGESDRLVNDHLRITRRAHAVVERVFWE